MSRDLHYTTLGFYVWLHMCTFWSFHMYFAWKLFIRIAVVSSCGLFGSDGGNGKAENERDKGGVNYKIWQSEMRTIAGETAEEPDADQPATTVFLSWSVILLHP